MTRHKPRGIAAYLLAHGREYEPAEPTLDETAFVERVIERTTRLSWRDRAWPYRKGDCFNNAQRFAFSARKGCNGLRVEYVEGVAFALGMVHHAWVAINGKVLDVTWTERRGLSSDNHPLLVLSKLGDIRAQREVAVWGRCRPGYYFGVPFDVSVVDVPALYEQHGLSVPCVGSLLVTRQGPRPAAVLAALGGPPLAE